MNLEQFFKLVTGIKTAATHAGIDAKNATIQIHSNGNVPTDITVLGEGAHGAVKLLFEID